MSSTHVPDIKSEAAQGDLSLSPLVDPPDLNIHALNTLRDSLLSFPEGSDDHLDTMEKLAKLHLARFEAAVQFPSEDLNEAIDLRREICRLCTQPSLRHLHATHSLAELLQFRCYSVAPRAGFIPTKKIKRWGKADLDELTTSLKRALPECRLDHSLLLPFVSMLGAALIRQGDLTDLQESVRLFRRALSLCSEKNEYRHLVLLNQCEALGTLVGASDRRAVRAEIAELANICQEIVDHFTDSDEARIQALHDTGHWLEYLCSPPLSVADRFADLRSLAHEIIKLVPMDTSAHRYLKVASAEAENVRADSSGQQKQIGPATGPAIGPMIRSVMGPTVGPKIEPTLLSTPWAAPEKTNRTPQNTDAGITEEFIRYARQKLQEKRSASHLKNLAILLEKLVDTNHSQDLNNLSEALELYREADLPNWQLPVQLCWFQKSGDVNHLNALIGDIPLVVADLLLSVPLLAEALHERYVWGGQISDLERAISLIKEAQVHVAEGREPTLPKGAILAESDALALCLNERYACLGNVEDLEESLRLTTSDYIAEAYMHQYERLGRTEDLESAARCKYSKKRHLDTSKEGGCYLDLRKRSTLCQVLLAQYERKPDPSLLERAMFAVNDALTCCAEGHILYPVLCHRQASALTVSSNKDISKLEDAIAAEKRALDHLPPNSIHRPHFMASLGELWSKKYSLTGQVADLSAGIESVRSALSRLERSNPSWGKYSYTLGQALQKYAEIDTQSSILDALVSFREAALSPTVSRKIEFESAVKWAHAAESLGLPEALEAYEISLAAFSDIAWIGLDVRDRHNAVTSSTTDLASNAATCAIRFGALEKAVEFVEHGRAVFWQQAMRLRSPTEELMDTEPELATRLTELARDINISSFYTRSADDTTARSAFLAREEPKRRKLVSEWDSLVDKARNVPGFEDFLKPLQYKRLVAAAKNSIVVMLCATDKTCHAIILDDTSLKCLELPLMTKQEAQKYTTDLQFTLRRSNRQFRADMETHRHIIPKSTSIPSAESVLTHILSKLWLDVVKPVLDFVDVEKSENPPRLTWCPAGVLALLPIHAAGIYHGPHQEGISDYVVSSYTPTLTNILPQKLRNLNETKLLMVGQAASPGQAPLPNTTLELDEIMRVIESKTRSVTYTVMKDEQAKRTAVLTEMARSNLVHLACHGTSRDNSLHSAVILQDGTLDVETMMRTPFSDARLVFLSACQTAQLNSSEPDESIHIASAMIFSGFKTAVGTMWSIGDADAPVIAKTFYQYLAKSGTMECSDAALALHQSVKEFRAKGASVLSWAPFIHLGL